MHDCLRDATPGQPHCITCHAIGHHYTEHWPFNAFQPVPPANPKDEHNTLNINPSGEGNTNE